MTRSAARSRDRLLGPALALLALLGGGPAEASRIPRRHAPPPRVRPYSEAFYAQALLRHRTVPVPYALRALKAEDGMLPDTAFIDYLRWRRGLNPARFDRWHPFMGLMLERDLVIRAQLPAFPPFAPSLHPPQVDAQPPIRQVIVPPEGPRVPEPSTLLMGVAMIGAVAWARRRRGDQAGPGATLGNRSATGVRNPGTIAPPSSSSS